MSARARGWPVGLAALVAAVSFAHASCGGAQTGGAAAPHATSSSSAGPASSGSATPASAATAMQPTVVEVGGVETDVFPCTVATREPCYEHASHVANVIGDMVEVEDEQDQRSIELANQAIRSSDALVHEEGLRLLGQFARDCNVARGAVSSLLDPHPTIQDMAAKVLDRCNDTTYLAKQWFAGHTIDERDVDSYDHEPKVDASTWGFAAYAGAQPYPPGYTRHGVSFSTHDDVATVASFYARSLGSQPFDGSELQRRMNALMQTDIAQMKTVQAQIQPLMQQYMKTRDPKILEQIKALSAGMKAQNVSSANQGPYGSINVPSRRDVEASVRFIAADDGAFKPGRLATIYRDPTYGLTVIELAWDPRAHPAPIPRPPSIHLRNPAP